MVDDDPAVRARALADLVTEDVVVRDGFAALGSRADLEAHIAASRLHMPGMTLARTGAPRAVQGTVLSDFSVLGPDGVARGGGTNLYDLDADGRIAKVVGFPAS